MSETTGKYKSELTLEQIHTPPFKTRVERDARMEFHARKEEVLDTIRDEGVKTLTEDILKTINIDDLEALKDKHWPTAEKRGDNYGYKYLDAPFWAAKGAQFALALGMDVPEKKRVLDLGCGAGFFTAALRMLGHEAIATDIRNRLYDEIASLIHVDRIELRVDRFVPLPRFGEGLDLVTGYAILFDRIRHEDAPQEMWGRAEWSYFLHDVASDKLNDDGRIYLLLNRAVNLPAELGENVYDPRILDYAKELGAKVNSPGMLFQNSEEFRTKLRNNLDG